VTDTPPEVTVRPLVAVVPASDTVNKGVPADESWSRFVPGITGAVRSPRIALPP
jgi:hypothetical protein